jgi:carboxyl-terminal processing protease
VKLLTTRKTIVLVLSVVLCVYALGAFADSKLSSSNENIYHDLDVFAKIVEKVKLYYVDDVDSHQLINDAIDSMLKELDPHSQYLSGLDYEDLMVSTRGEFGGLGIFISFRDNYPTVISPIDDTPADRAGIRGGDRIVEIEGQSTEGWRTDKAVGLLRGAPGSSVRFKVTRPGLDDPIEYVITREVINVKSVPHYGMYGGDKTTGYIKVSSFSKHTTEELESAIEDLESQGMKSLVLDFRSNPGGLLETSREVAEMFLGKDKLIVFTKGRLPSSNRKYYSHNRSPHGGYPIVVMINGASASASEIFAGALQDWDAGFVVGQRSFGKGTVQTVFNLSDTEAVKLTTAKYYTPSGRSIHMDEKAREAHIAEMRALMEGDEPASDAGDKDAAVAPEDDGDDLTTADVTDTDSEQPVYYTSSGRIVYGGGGITPDLQFEPRTYTELQRRLERDALAFSFAVEYLTDHDIDDNLTVTDEMMDQFLDFIKSRDFTYEEKDLTDENRSYIRTMLRRELATNKFGRQAAYRVVTEADEEFQEVIDILKGAHNLEALYQYAEEQKAVKKASNE